MNHLGAIREHQGTELETGDSIFEEQQPARQVQSKVIPG